MKMRKAISLFSALAVMASMFTAFATTSFAAPAADSKPEIVGDIVEIDGDGYAIMQFKLVNNEELFYELSRGKVTSNGINAIQVSVTLDDSVFDTTETYMTPGHTGVSTSGDNTDTLTYVFGPSSVDSYMIEVPEYLFQVDALVKGDYTAETIPSSAVTFGATKVEYTSYDGVATSDGATTYTIYAANTEATHDYTMNVAFNGAEDEPEPAITVKAVNVTPATTTVAGEAQETFKAEVIGSDDNPYSDQNVTWSATAGTITEEGVFTAPAATDEDQTITITATSVADDSVSGTATVTVPKKDEPQPQQPTTDITGAAVEKGVYFDVTMNGNGESITDANVVVAGPTEDGEGKEVTFKVIGYGDIQGELSFIIGILTDIAGDYKGTSNVTTGVGAATDSATVAFPAAQ